MKKNEFELSEFRAFFEKSLKEREVEMKKCEVLSGGDIVKLEAIVDRKIENDVLVAFLSEYFSRKNFSLAREFCSEEDLGCLDFYNLESQCLILVNFSNASNKEKKIWITLKKFSNVGVA